MPSTPVASLLQRATACHGPQHAQLRQVFSLCNFWVPLCPAWPQNVPLLLQTTAYYAPQFAQLRRHCVVGGEAAFLVSMARCRKWSSRGGKSSAFFAKTRDDRYVVKQLLKSEKQSFLEFAPVYFRWA